MSKPKKLTEEQVKQWVEDCCICTLAVFKQGKADVRKTLNRLLIVLGEAGYRSPSEVRELEREAMERVIDDIADYLNIQIRQCEAEEKKALGRDDKIIILLQWQARKSGLKVTKMYVEALKSSLLEG